MILPPITQPPIVLQLFVAAKSAGMSALERATEERGEGVISAAIAVLIMAFLGVAAWLAFKGIFDGASEKAEQQINQVGT
jgi:hypothetical protein